MEDFKYRWKDEVAPELNDNFKWRFAMDALKPKMQIEGPSVGSLLYAMNPKTSELGLKQMDSELNQQLAANANFDKRGDAAMKFMEQRVAEDIANKQFADKMNLERIKAQNVDAGHFNSLLSNYTQALQGGNETAIAVIEDQIRKSVPNGEALIAQGREMASKGAGQDEAYYELMGEIPTGYMWNTPGQREAFVNKVNSSNLNAKQKSDLITKARSVNDLKRFGNLQNTTAIINALAANAGGKAGGNAKVNDYNTWLANNKQRLIDEGYETDYSWRKQYKLETGMEAP